MSKHEIQVDIFLFSKQPTTRQLPRNWFVMATTEVADGRDYNQLVQDNVALLEKSNSVVVLLNAIEQALPKVRSRFSNCASASDTHHRCSWVVQIQVMSFNQSNFISSLISLLSSTSSSVANPGSNASFNYKTVTRILIAYLAKIDLSKELFNLIQSLIAILNLVPSGLDKERMIANKVGACWAVGEIWSHYGNGVRFDSSMYSSFYVPTLSLSS